MICCNFQNQCRKALIFYVQQKRNLIIPKPDNRNLTIPWPRRRGLASLESAELCNFLRNCATLSVAIDSGKRICYNKRKTVEYTLGTFVQKGENYETWRIEQCLVFEQRKCSDGDCIRYSVM